MNYLTTEINGRCDWLRMLKDMHPESETFDRTPPRPSCVRPLGFWLSVCPIKKHHTEATDKHQSVLKWAYAGGVKRFRLLQLTPKDWAMHGGVALYLMRMKKHQ